MAKKKSASGAKSSRTSAKKKPRTKAIKKSNLVNASSAEPVVVKATEQEKNIQADYYPGVLGGGRVGDLVQVGVKTADGYETQTRRVMSPKQPTTKAIAPRHPCKWQYDEPPCSPEHEVQIDLVKEDGTTTRKIIKVPETMLVSMRAFAPKRNRYLNDLRIMLDTMSYKEIHESTLINWEALLETLENQRLVMKSWNSRKARFFRWIKSFMPNLSFGRNRKKQMQREQEDERPSETWLNEHLNKMKRDDFLDKILLD
jgi:hypothetical protein